MRSFLISVFVIMLSACSAIKDNPHYYPENSYSLTLDHPITVFPGASNAYIVNGEVVHSQQIGTFDLYCKLAIPRPKDSGEIIIQPDVFKISNVYERYSSSIQPIDPSGIQVARLELASFSGGGGGGSSRQNLTLYFAIYSSNQPHVKSMSCIRFADPRPYNMPTLQDAQSAFQDLGVISKANN